MRAPILLPALLVALAACDGGHSGPRGSVAQPEGTPRDERAVRAAAPRNELVLAERSTGASQGAATRSGEDSASVPEALPGPVVARPRTVELLYPKPEPEPRVRNLAKLDTGEAGRRLAQRIEENLRAGQEKQDAYRRKHAMTKKVLKRRKARASGQDAPVGGGR